jgi:hypothetical protein
MSLRVAMSGLPDILLGATEDNDDLYACH